MQFKYFKYIHEHLIKSTIHKDFLKLVIKSKALMLLTNHIMLEGELKYYNKVFSCLLFCLGSLGKNKNWSNFFLIS